jgi:flagellin-like protein
MNIRSLIQDEDAVSPVIGVILMVAITVILAAVIGTFVLGLGGNVESAPQAQLTFEYVDINDGTAGNDVVEITHDGGDSITNTNIDVTIAGNLAYDDGADGSGFSSDSVTTWPATVTAGDTLVIDEDGTDEFGDGDEVRVIWQSPSSDTTQTIASGTIG